MPLAYTVQEKADPAELAVVDSGLGAYNLTEKETQRVRGLHVLVHDDVGAVAGGAVGRTWGECCELMQLWVHEAQRGRGVGARLMALLEDEAARRGCTLVYLTTFSFQAPDFYARLGYEVVLETRGYTGQIVRYTMHKHLPARGAAA